MRLGRITVLAVLAVGFAACTKDNSNYCGNAADAGFNCLAADAAAHAEHPAPDGRDGGDARSDAADASDASDGKTPICMTDDNCAGADAGTPACEIKGDAGARCVECTKNAHCSGDKPVCDTKTDTCVACTGEAANNALECKTGTSNVCNTATMSCVECVENKTCGSAKPVCDKGTNVCRTCRADSECAGIGPGICVDFDGHCASAGEIVTLQGGASCTAAGKLFCTGSDAVNALDADHAILLVQGPDPVSTIVPPAGAPPNVLIVGRGAATVAAGAGDIAGIRLSGAHKFWVRDLKVSGGTVGVVADSGADLHVTRCVVAMNGKGGIKTANASFDITNTVIAANNAGTDTGGVVWGGVRLGDIPTAGTSHFENNTVVDNLATGISCVNTYGIAGSIVHDNTSANIAGCATTTPCCGATDPDPGLNASYHLMSGSPCIDKITATTMSLAVDIDGQSRPSPPGLLDCGADEFVAQ
jgi:hypothetical protein